MPSRSFFDLDRSELESLLAEIGEARYRVEQVWRAAYRDRVASYDDMMTLPRGLRERLAETLPYDPLRSIDWQTSGDGATRKALLRLVDDETIETVLMDYERRRTVCVSTQVGCVLECAFCATGASGYHRDLSTGEIVAQVILAARVFDERGERLTNVVYMGMGEPLLNYEATMRSIRRLNDPSGFGLGARAFTVSTAGIVPGIERFAEEGIQANLAVSLHAASDALRDRLVPVNRRYPVDSLLTACRTYVSRTRRRVTFEVALIEGVNDATSHAREMVERLAGLLAHVNLIPLNPGDRTTLRGSPRDRVDAFAETLRAGGIPTTIRLGRGADIRAGCGQLRSRRPASTDS